MARMYPIKPRAETKSYAEILLFNEFDHQLPDTYDVFHSVAWQTRNLRDGTRDGEADFLIINPTGSLLVVEVKGGKRIKYDATNDEWMSNNHIIKDPFRQGVSAAHSLLAKLNDNFGSTYPFRIGNAVAFPEVEVKGNLGLNKDREIILDINDVEKLSFWIDTVFSKLKIENRMPKSTRERIKNILYSSREFSQPLTHYFASVNRIINQLTEEQYKIIDYLKRYRQLAINGCAGSGKTLLAIEKAIRLDREKFSVLLLCHNPYLAEDIKQKITGTNIIVYSFTNYVKEIINISMLPNSRSNTYLEDESKWTEFDAPSQDEMNIAFEVLLNNPPKFNAVIVDEGQDFHDDWWIIVQACLGDDKNDILYIFFDENQQISPFPKLQFPVPVATMDLSRNCRNAGEIYKIVRHLNPHMPEESIELSREGVVKIWTYSTENDLWDNLHEVFIEAENYSPNLKDIVIMTAEIAPIADSILNSMVFDTLSLKNSKK
jgi:hypothetical protein